jgi:uncharacterized membrane protein (DUF106 family)
MIQEFIKSEPLLSIVLFSLVITFILTLVYKWLIPQDKMKELKQKTKELQAKMKNEKDSEKLMGIQKEMLQISGEQMRLSLKPMIFTFLPLIAVFAFLRGAYAGTGDLIYWGANLPIIGTGAGWLLCYIIFSIIFSIILRKILGVQ